MSSNNILLAHIGGEVVALAGLAFYFHKQNAALNERIATLEKNNLELQRGVTDLVNQVNTIYSILTREAASPPTAPVSQPSSILRQRKPTPQQSAAPAPIQQQPAAPKMAAPKVLAVSFETVPIVSKSNSAAVGQSTRIEQVTEFDPSELDKELAAIESENCEGDQCKLVDD